MASFLCTRTCYIRPRKGAKPRLFERNSVHSFDEMPEGDCFMSLDNNTEIDFETASEDLLLSSDNWKKADLRDFVREKYNVKIPDELDRKNTVSKLISARENFIDLNKINKTSFPKDDEPVGN